MFQQKTKKKHEKYVEMSRNNDYTGNLLDIGYFSNNYKLIIIDLASNLNQKMLIQCNKLILLVDVKETNEQQCFLSLKKKEETTLGFSKNAVSII